MCEYCAYVSDDDNELKDLFNMPINFGLGKGHAYYEIGSLAGCLVSKGTIEVSINAQNGEPIDYFNVPIKYCPMCGESIEKLKALRDV